VKKLDPASPDAYRRLYIQQFDLALSARTTLLMAQSKAWMLLFESKIQSCLRFENNAHASYELFGSILLKGLSLAKRLSYLAQSCLVMHSTMQVRELAIGCCFPPAITGEVYVPAFGHPYVPNFLWPVLTLPFLCGLIVRC
jgi:hypothetical protein